MVYQLPTDWLGIVINIEVKLHVIIEDTKAKSNDMLSLFSSVSAQNKII